MKYVACMSYTRGLEELNRRRTMSIEKPALYLVAVFDEPAPKVDAIVKCLTVVKNCTVSRLTPEKR